MKAGRIRILHIKGWSRSPGGGGEINGLEGGIEDNGKEEHQIYEISGSHGGKYEDDSLVGYSTI
jgi:hypothetical protein